MPVDYVAKIRRVTTQGLVRMLVRLETNQPIRGWPPGKAFEHIVLRSFDLEPEAAVVWPYVVPWQGGIIEQIDGAVHAAGLYCLVEAKDHRNPQNIEPIAKLRNQLMRRPAGCIGLVFSMSDFSVPAKLLTQMMNPLSILLWDYEELKHAVSHQIMIQSLKTKYLFAVEWGMADYDIRKGLR